MTLSVFFQHAKEAAAQRGEDLSATLRRFRAAGIETVELDLGDATPETRAVLRDAGLRVPPSTRPTRRSCSAPSPWRRRTS